MGGSALTWSPLLDIIKLQVSDEAGFNLAKHVTPSYLINRSLKVRHIVSVFYGHTHQFVVGCCSHSPWPAGKFTRVTTIYVQWVEVPVDHCLQGHTYGK